MGGGRTPGRNDDVYIVVPVFNEAAVLAGVLRELVGIFPRVVCVDDGSTDDSSHVIRGSGAVLVRHPVNLGQGAAIQTGVEFARAQPEVRFLVTFDADGQHRVDDVEAMLTHLRADEADVVVGSRFTGSAEQMPPLRRAALRFAVWLSPTTRRLGLTDTHNGLRAFNRRVADALDLRCNGMAHASEFIAAIRHHSWRVVEEPVRIRYTAYSLSKGQSLVNGVNIGFESALRRFR